MQVIDAFIQVVEQQVALIGQLIALAEKKQEHINNAEQVAMITHDEQELIEQLQAIEKERHGLFDVISPNHTIKEWLEQVEHPTLNELYQELQDRFSRLRSINATNQELIRESLNFVQFSLNLLIDDVPSTYEKKGPQPSHKTLFDRKV